MLIAQGLAAFALWTGRGADGGLGGGIPAAAAARAVFRALEGGR